MRVRRNQNTLTAAEKARYVAAVKQMKLMPGVTIGGTPYNAYDKYVRWHNDAATYLHSHHNHPPGDPQNHPHSNPAFGPWHRYFITAFETDLIAADRALGGDGNIALPYWDWVHDHGGSAGRQRSSIWNEDFMGPDGSGGDAAVQAGPFRRGEWTLNFVDPTAGPRYQVTFLQREFAQGAGSLPSQEAVDHALDADVYDQQPWDRTVDTFRNRLEGWTGPETGPNVHNRVHVWVGGTMSWASSPNDPVFFIHHCNVDRLWSLWQDRHPVATFAGARYPTSRATFDRPVTEGPDPGVGLDDPMYPWDGVNAPGPQVRPRDVLNPATMNIGGVDLSFRYSTGTPSGNAGG